MYNPRNPMQSPLWGDKIVAGRIVRRTVRPLSGQPGGSPISPTLVQPTTGSTPGGGVGGGSGGGGPPPPWEIGEWERFHHTVAAQPLPQMRPRGAFLSQTVAHAFSRSPLVGGLVQGGPTQSILSFLPAFGESIVALVRYEDILWFKRQKSREFANPSDPPVLGTEEFLSTKRLVRRYIHDAFEKMKDLMTEMVQSLEDLSPDGRRALDSTIDTLATKLNDWIDDPDETLEMLTNLATARFVTTGQSIRPLLASLTSCRLSYLDFIIELKPSTGEESLQAAYVVLLKSAESMHPPPAPPPAPSPRGLQA